MPAAWIGNRVLCESTNARYWWLLACSLFFYAWWNPVYVPLLLASICFNFYAGEWIKAKPQKHKLVIGITANLLLLGYFKYSHFAAANFQSLTGIDLGFHALALPLAISFITFQKIAYLVDCNGGGVRKYSLLEFAIFASFFPQLIAGPIVHHGELIPQLAAAPNRFGSDLSVGVTIFALGLFKKAVLADGFAPYANSLFNDPSAWSSPTLVHSWVGVLCYGFQIYFDFSGYSDMAIGAARILGIGLPLNFFSPYCALSISDFWRRWHMTLSRFLRDYLYIPLGGNRFGLLNRYRNLLITMLLGGVWHGAGWTFMLWGLLHGTFLVVQHGWSRLTNRWGSVKSLVVYKVFALLTTFIAVHFAWVFFRAESMQCANHIVQGMVGWNGISLPSAIWNRLGFESGDFGILTDRVGGATFVASIGWVALGFAIVWFLPTTQQFLDSFQPAMDYNSALSTDFDQNTIRCRAHLRWSPSPQYALLIALLATAGILSLPEVSEFLYFQF